LPSAPCTASQPSPSIATSKSRPVCCRATGDVAASAINLDETLSIQNIVKLHEELKKSYAANDAIEIDASHVAAIDTATLQLFVALRKDAAKQKKEVVFFQPSQRFIESARLLGLLEILGITSV
jgi:anti-anti-sigma regulatory factor